MAESGFFAHGRDPIKSSVGNLAAQRRRQTAVTVSKERRETLVRSKRLCRAVPSSDADVIADSVTSADEVESGLEARTSLAVQELKSALDYQGRGAMQKKISALHELRCLLSRYELPPVEAALNAGAIPMLVQCLSFGSPDEQLFEAAWCLTNIAAGRQEETKAILPALPFLIAHLGEKSSIHVAEQCAWVLGNAAGEGEEFRNLLLSQGALQPLARMILPNKGSSVRTAAWALSNLIRGPDSKAATELIMVDGVRDAILWHLQKADEELATEVAWVVVYLSALSNAATSLLAKADVLQILVQRLATTADLQLLVPALRSLGNFISADSFVISDVLLPGHQITDDFIVVLVKCLKSGQGVLMKEAAWVLSNVAAGSMDHKLLVYSSEAVPILLRLLSAAPFDIRKEVAYALGNLCVAPEQGHGVPQLIPDHLISLVDRGCLPGFIGLIRCVDSEVSRLGLQFMEMVLRGMPNGDGPKLVEQEDGIEALERLQFHENEELKRMATNLIDTYFSDDYGLDH